MTDEHTKSAALTGTAVLFSTGGSERPGEEKRKEQTDETLLS